MSWSLKLLTVRGIPIRVHASFLLILVWAAWIGLTSARFGQAPGDSALGSMGFMVLFTLLLFFCVVLHELGHSLVAQGFGVKVHDITLWPVGGVARLANMPRRPLHEFLITAAGPSVNVVLAVLLALLALAWIGPVQLVHTVGTGRGIARLLDSHTGQSLVVLLAVQNVLLALFNLIPRSRWTAAGCCARFLRRSSRSAPPPARHRSSARAWRWCCSASRSSRRATSFMTIVAAFVFLAAWQERCQVVALDNLAGCTVRDAMQPLGARLSSGDLLLDTVRRAAVGRQHAFAVVDGDRFAGVITRDALIGAAKKAGAADTVGQHLPQAHTFQMRCPICRWSTRRSACRPNTWRSSSMAARSSG